MNERQPVQIRKAKMIEGKSLNFRDAHESDARFILSLRRDPEKSRYLSVVASEIEQQQAWLQRYTFATDQAYFVIEHQQQPIGTVRLYDAQGDSFCWGSWILSNCCPTHAALESALMVYAYALDHLGFQASHFDVRRGNERVWNFHERFGAQKVAETELDYVYKISHQAITTSRHRYRRFLAEAVTVTYP